MPKSTKSSKVRAKMINASINASIDNSPSSDFPAYIQQAKEEITYPDILDRLNKKALVTCYVLGDGSGDMTNGFEALDYLYYLYTCKKFPPITFFVLIPDKDNYRKMLNEAIERNAWDQRTDLVLITHTYKYNNDSFSPDFSEKICAELYKHKEAMKNLAMYIDVSTSMITSYYKEINSYFRSRGERPPFDNTVLPLFIAEHGGATPISPAADRNETYSKPNFSTIAMGVHANHKGLLLKKIESLQDRDYAKILNSLENEDLKNTISAIGNTTDFFNHYLFAPCYFQNGYSVTLFINMLLNSPLAEKYKKGIVVALNESMFNAITEKNILLLEEIPGTETVGKIPIIKVAYKTNNVTFISLPYLSAHDYDKLFQLAQVVIGCSGDKTFEKAIMVGALPFYDAPIWKKHFFQDFLNYLKESSDEIFSFFQQLNVTDYSKSTRYYDVSIRGLHQNSEQIFDHLNELRYTALPTFPKTFDAFDKSVLRDRFRANYYFRIAVEGQPQKRGKELGNLLTEDTLVAWRKIQSNLFENKNLYKKLPCIISNANQIASFLQRLKQEGYLSNNVWRETPDEIINGAFFHPNPRLFVAAIINRRFIPIPAEHYAGAVFLLAAIGFFYYLLCERNVMNYTNYALGAMALTLGMLYLTKDYISASASKDYVSVSSSSRDSFFPPKNSASESQPPAEQYQNAKSSIRY